MRAKRLSDKRIRAHKQRVKDPQGNLGGGFSLGQTRCVQLNHDDDDIEFPLIEDQVADTIIYDSFLECGNEMKEKTNTTRQNLSQCMEFPEDFLPYNSNAAVDSNTIGAMKQLQQKLGITGDACAFPQYKSDNLQMVISLFPRDCTRKDNIEQQTKQAKNKTNNTLHSNRYEFPKEPDTKSIKCHRDANDDCKGKLGRIMDEHSPSIISETYTTGSAVSIRSGAPFNLCAREARRKLNIFIRNRSKELKKNEIAGSQKIKTDQNNNVGTNDFSSPEQQLYQLYPKGNTGSNVSHKKNQKISSFNTPHMPQSYGNQESNKNGINSVQPSIKPLHNGTEPRKDTTELLYVLGTQMPLFRTSENLDKSKLHSSSDNNVSCVNSLLHPTLSKINCNLPENIAQSNNFATDLMYPYSQIKFTSSKSDLKYEPESKDMTFMDIDFESKKKVSKSRETCTSNRQHTERKRPPKTDEAEPIIEKSKQADCHAERDCLLQKRVSFSPETYTSLTNNMRTENITLSKRPLRTSQRTRMRRLNGLEEI